MSTADDIEKYLKANAKTDVHTVLADHQRAHAILLFGETHIGWNRKAPHFARMIRDSKRSGLIRFHASEFFRNDVPGDAKAIDRFLKKEAKNSDLPSDWRELAPILEAARESQPGFGIVFAGSGSVHDGRDAELYKNFTSSRKLHLKAKRFADSDKGHFHLGAAHAGRVPLEGSEATTCGRLIKDGFDVYVVRLTIDIEGDSEVKKIDGKPTMIVKPGEGVTYQEAADADPSDLLPILRNVAAGKPFIVDLNGSRSPFVRLQADYGKAMFTKRYDSLLHLPVP